MARNTKVEADHNAPPITHGEYAGGNGNIDGQALQLEHAKGLPNELHGEVFSEQRMELARW